MSLERFDSRTALASLKVFQQRTVDYVLDRMFNGPDPARQFLVADEVGLGKTMVARGVIGKALEHMWDSVERIDVLYICSNQAIAAQNIRRLNVFGKKELALPTRMTLVPLRMQDKNSMARNKVNFISLTPGTSFDLRSATGVVEERAFLYHLLEPIQPSRAKRYNLLQVGAKKPTWNWAIGQVKLKGVEDSIVSSFLDDVQRDTSFSQELAKAFEMFGYRRTSWTQQQKQTRNRVVARLRAKLSRACVHALEPDLIILDEFQRFRELLHGDSEAADLARALFDYTHNGQSARTLLLSATPYKMLTLQGDAEEDGHHFRDFLDTLSFLYGGERGAEVARALEVEMQSFRRFLHALPGSHESALQAKTRVEDRLRQVISRTERVNNTVERDSMCREVAMTLIIEPVDLLHASLVSKVARLLDVPDITEYWKSAPYLLNFMRDYVLKRQLKDRADRSNPALAEAMRRARPALLDRAAIDRYEPVDLANGRMRALASDVFEQGLDQHLWLPPSLPYYGSARADTPLTKSLIFSSWSMVPDAIAALISYEAERRTVAAGSAKDKSPQYFDGTRTRPLKFTRDRERLAGLRAMSLIYPSPTLASLVDPYLEFAQADGPLSLEDMQAAARRQLIGAQDDLVQVADGNADIDLEWEWAASVVLDCRRFSAVRPWLSAADGFRSINATAPDKQAPAGDDVRNDDSGFTDHTAALAAAADAHGRGALPEHLLELLADIALGSPAVCALRSLRRVAPDLTWDNAALLKGAADVAWAFRTLFNQHESVSLVRGESDERYWQAVLHFCATHNLQAVLDEYAHYLVDAEGLTSKGSEERVKGVSAAMANALSIRPAQIEVDDPGTDGDKLRIDRFQMRGRFAMRLGDYKDEQNGAARLGAVRDAFNSPFRPFVLASTSVGQEGLDFHPYCYRIYHWNLPGNPVDLEQREGRIHRFKSHAVRLNLAHDHQQDLRSQPTPAADPWAAMFAAARAKTSNNSDLVPYWIYEGAVKVERRVPMLPFSREEQRLKWLKRSLTVYRLAFGQPRQDDLLEYLEKLSMQVPAEDLERLQISLAPLVAQEVKQSATTSFT